MGRAVIVKASALTKYRRMDAGFFVGLVDGREADAAIEAAQQAHARALARLQRTIDAKVKVAARAKKLIDDGDVVPIDDQPT